jgi:AraC-like DNA-binding protein
MPQDHQLICGIFNDTAMVHFQILGNWQTETKTGVHRPGRSALIFGPHSKRLSHSSSGSFTSVGYALRAGALGALTGRRMADMVDHFVTLPEADYDNAPPMTSLDPDASAEDSLRELEGSVRAWVHRHGTAVPEELTKSFENQAFVNPSATIKAFARERGVSERTVERIVKRDFGMSPKQVLRRARAFDFASYLAGIADPSEGDELILRYFDESHVIHEFTDLFGMSPGQFSARPQPLLTLTLEMRQARRLEILQRIEPGMKRPWQ